MPIKDNAFTDPELIEALYQDPESEALLVAYAIETGGIMTGAVAQVTASAVSGGSGLGGDSGADDGGGEVIFRPRRKVDPLDPDPFDPVS